MTIPLTAEAAYFGYPPTDTYEPDRDDIVRYLQSLEALASGAIEQVVGSVADLNATVGVGAVAIGLVVAPVDEGGGAYKWTGGASWDLIGPLPTVLATSTLGPEVDAALVEMRAIRDGLRAPSAVGGPAGTPPEVNVDPVTGDVEFVIPAGEKGDIGDIGNEGDSAYEVWLAAGNTGTVGDFFEFLRGPQGEAGEVTLDGTQTLTNKTLTTPTLTTPLVNVGSDAPGDLYQRNAGGTGIERIAVGASGTALVSDGTSWAAGTVSGAPSFVLEDQKASGTDGGSSTTTWSTRDLNTSVLDGGGAVTLSVNQFTSTKAGWVEFEIPLFATGLSHTRLYNVTDSVVVAEGDPSYSNQGSPSIVKSTGGAAIIAGKTYRLEAIATTAKASNGWGWASGKGTVERYARVKGWF